MTSNPQKATKFTWNARRLKAAELIAEGNMTHEEIGKVCGVRRDTVSKWNQFPEFKEKVTELVLLDERATKAGIVRRALSSLDLKSNMVGSDRTTELDYLKFLADLMGITDHHAHVNIMNTIGIINSPEIVEQANELSRKLNTIYEAEQDGN